MRRVIILSALFLMFVLTGCGEKSQPGFNMNDMESVEYKKTDTVEYKIDSEGIRTFFLMPDMSLAYVSEDTNKGVIVRKCINDGKETDRILEVAGSYFLAVSKNADGAITIITASDNEYYLNYFDGEERKENVSVPRTLTEDEYPVFSCKTETGQFMLLTHSEAFLIDDSGKVIKEKEYAEGSINRVIQLSDGTVCVTNTVSGNNKNISIIDGQSLELSSKVRIDIYTSLLCENGGTCLFSDSHDIYSFSVSESQTHKFCSLQNFYLRSECICDISFYDEKMFIAYYDEKNSRNTAKVLVFEKKETDLQEMRNQSDYYDENGKRIIYIYSSSGMDYISSAFGEAIKEFNIDNPDYAVIIKEGQSKIDIAIDKDFNPDIICEAQTTVISKYSRVGYLEDLWPYIDESSSFKRSDFNDVLKKMYERDGHLYGITSEVSIKGICITDAGENFDGAWTVEEFVDWLFNHKDVVTASGINSPFICGMILPGLIEDNVDFYTKKANFDNERFARIVEKVKSLSFENEEMRLSEAELIDAAHSHPFLRSGTIGSIEDMAMYDSMLGKKLYYLGYPSDSDVAEGILSPLFNVAITTDSECKEGAFAFIEYWLEYQQRMHENDIKNTNEAGQKRGTMSVFNHVFEENLKAGLGERKIVYESDSNAELTLKLNVTENYVDAAKEMLGAAEPETYEKYQIKLILAEELTNYLNGVSDSESVAKVIQSRVQLFLNESR